MDRVEILADAIVAYSGYKDPTSDCYKARNPGALKAFSIKHRRLDNGLRVFESHLAGYDALLFDLRTKINDRSDSGIKSTSPFRELAYALGFKQAAVRSLLKFIRRATGDDTITADTAILYFKE